MIRHLLPLLEGNLSSALKISLVADQDASDVILGIFFDLAHPGVHGGERVTVSDVVNHNDAVGALVVARRDGLEALLTSSIPDLQLANLVVDVDGANLEVDADCWHEVLLELVILL